MIDAEDLIKAREILKKEAESYTSLGFGETTIYKRLALKYTSSSGNYVTLKKFVNQKLVSFTAAENIANNILEKQNEQR
tara:strand:+ start:174 stop:410 length:237 start_codon:yes stop_codon:yes gene_type:complete